MANINQKEYLKKYLGIGKSPGAKKKKKKKEKTVGDRLKIIDDDVDVLISREIEEDIAAANEDAPQIVAVIDERPIELQIDEKTKSSLWKPLGEPSSKAADIQTVQVNSFKLSKQVKNTDHKKSSIKIKLSAPEIISKKEISPVRAKVKDGGYNESISKNSEKSYSRHRKYSTEDDDSPSRKRRSHDLSPRENYDSSPPRKKPGDKDSSPKRIDRDYDNSPPRKQIKEEDSSPPRKKYKDNSPQRRGKDDNHSSPRTQYKENSLSPKQQVPSSTQQNRRDRKGKKSRWSPERSPEPSGSQKMKKTLDGKQAGLQNAKDLSQESKYLRQKEDEIFKNMSAEVSGRNAATVVRVKKVKDLEEEAAKERKEKEMKEKYDRWGKGLKQVEDRNKIIEDQLHEMSKPLARYADDEDLEKFLKDQEREGDPMLNYIRKKKKKEKIAAGIPDKPMYNGEFMPNRFGIRPGYRWDGVDRSNGYEKKWFQVQNAKRANREEAFKWSTEDM